MWMILSVSRSMMPYKPYLAECPGLSARPSPPMDKGVPQLLHSVSNFCCLVSQTETMAG